MCLPELAAEQDRRGAAHQRAHVLGRRPDGQCGNQGDVGHKHRQSEDCIVGRQRPEALQRDFVGKDPAKHLPELADEHRCIGGSEPQRHHQQDQGRRNA